MLAAAGLCGGTRCSTTYAAQPKGQTIYRRLISAKFYNDIVVNRVIFGVESEFFQLARHPAAQGRIGSRHKKQALAPLVSGKIGSAYQFLNWLAEEEGQSDDPVGKWVRLQGSI